MSKSLMLRPALSALAIAALLAGCSLAPTYERPPAPIASDWPAHLQPRPKTPVSVLGVEGTQAAQALPWRSFFTQPHVHTLIETALAHNRDLRIAALNVEAARAQFQIQRSAQFPSVAANASATRGHSAQAGGRIVNTFSAGLGIPAWELDFFGRIASLKDAALAQYLASDEARQAAELTIVSSVAQLWFTLVADEALLTLSRQTLQAREESTRLAEMQFNAGVLSELDWRGAQSLLEAARATYAQQQRQRAVDENALVLLLGQSLPTDASAWLQQHSGDVTKIGHKLEGQEAAAAQAALAPIAVGLPSELLTRRPDIRAAEQQLIAANANIGAARAAFFPSISLTGQYGSASAELSDLFKSGTWGFSVGPSITLPIFNMGRNQANLDAARARHGIAIAQYEKAIQSAFREVADALAGQSTLAEQARAQLAQTAAEHRRLALAELRWQNGAASSLDVLDARRALFALQQASIQTQLAVVLNRIALYKALGGGWNTASGTQSSEPATEATASAP